MLCARHFYMYLISCVQHPQCDIIILILKERGDFPDGPVVRTPQFQYRG